MGHRIFECALSIGTRSAQSIRASGTSAASTGRTRDRTRPMLQNVRKFLPRRRPHVTHSGRFAEHVGSKMPLASQMSVCGPTSFKTQRSAAGAPPVALWCARTRGMRAMSGLGARHVAVRHALLHAEIFRIRRFASLEANFLARFLLRKGRRGRKCKAQRGNDHCDFQHVSPPEQNDGREYRAGPPRAIVRAGARAIFNGVLTPPRTRWGGRGGH